MIQNHRLHLSMSYTFNELYGYRGMPISGERQMPGTCCSGDWSGIRESNPRLDLGKVAYYHYTNPAWKVFYSMRGWTATRVATRRRFG
jgi:hypothetical protein